MNRPVSSPRRRPERRFTAAALLLLAAFTAVAARAQTTGAAENAAEPVRAVYHIDGDIAYATGALHNISNQLDAAPDTQIVVVAIGQGVDFLLKGSKTAGGYPLALMVEDLRDRGVQFEACGNTLSSRKIDAGQLVEGVTVIASGMAELARLQYREGYAYLKP
jgi:uncharacterized protein